MDLTGWKMYREALTPGFFSDCTLRAASFPDTILREKKKVDGEKGKREEEIEQE